jgi:hypothetical protein
VDPAYAAQVNQELADADRAYVDASLKFDYFVAALAAAVLSYSVSAMPADASMAYRVMVPLSWLFLVGSLVSTHFRIRAWVRLLHLRRPTVSEQADTYAYRTAAMGKATLRRDTGEAYTREEASAASEAAAANLKSVTAQSKAAQTRAGRLEVVRDIAFLLGLLLLGVARIAAV